MISRWTCPSWSHPRRSVFRNIVSGNEDVDGRPEAIREDSKIVLREMFGWCVVIDEYMHLISDFLRGPLS